jgi:hypothetical protein
MDVMEVIGGKQDKLVNYSHSEISRSKLPTAQVACSISAGISRKPSICRRSMRPL